MVNFLEYFYNIKVNTIKNTGKYYVFVYNNYLYKLYIYETNKNVNQLVNMNKLLLHKTLISEIIINKNHNAISIYNGIPYILIKVYASSNNKINLEDIAYLSNSLYTYNLNINWGKLWSNKIDYLEDLINENGKKYPLIVDSFNYFVGMTENAISYYNNIKIDNNYTYYLSHRQLKYTDNIQELYNPLNIMFDYKVRDIAEYIKNSFFNNNTTIFIELNNYLKYNMLSNTDILLLISRILYPSFYFELYEDILIDNKDEKIIIPIISRLPNYEKYLANIFKYLSNHYDIPKISWLEKKDY